VKVSLLIKDAKKMKRENDHDKDPVTLSSQNLKRISEMFNRTSSTLIDDAQNEEKAQIREAKKLIQEHLLQAGLYS